MSRQKTYTTNARVRYAETDATGIVYYANYFIYFEVGRLEMFRELGLPYNRHLPIVDSYCKYHSSACFDDEIEIHSTVEEVRRKGFRIGHRIYRTLEGSDEPELLAEGYTSMVTADGDGRPILLPPAFKKAFGLASS